MAAFNGINMLLLLSLISIDVTGQFSPITNLSDCDASINCDGRGECVIGTNSSWSCKCNQGYVTYPAPDMPLSANAIYCNYEQKKQLTALILSCCLGVVGGGRRYVGSHWFAGLKLCFFVYSCYFCVFWFRCKGTKDISKDGLYYCLKGVTCVSFTAMIVLWIVDISLFSMNKIDDENGIPLQEW